MQLFVSFIGLFNLRQRNLRNMAKLKSNNEAKDAELKAVLNPAQYEKYQKMEKRAKQKVRERARERRAQRDTTLSTH